MDILADIMSSVEIGNVRRTELAVREALSLGIPADDVLDRALLPAMMESGRLYQADKIQIPELLCASKCLSVGLDILRPFLSFGGVLLTEKVIVGTVEGDLHDIGKNLVCIMLHAAGFEVIDLGVDVSSRQFTRALREHKDVRLVCLSCLLTTSMERMREIVSSLRAERKRGELKIMVGGAPITEEFAEEIGADFYTVDAFSAAEKAKEYVLAGMPEPGVQA